MSIIFLNKECYNDYRKEDLYDKIKKCFKILL